MSGRISAYEAGGESWEDLTEDEAPEERPARRLRTKDLRVETLLEAERFVVVAKPAGLLTVPGRRRTDGETVVERVHAAWRRRDPEVAAPVVCHRLDRDTSGCLVLARDREAAKELMTRFRKRHVEKSYLALVTGAPHPPEGEVEFRVAPDRRRPGTMWTPRKGGKACHDLYETVEVFRGVSLVRVRPQTGRTHEVRLALRTLGTPCAVDPLYGTNEPLLLSAWKRDYRTGRGRTERPLIDRLTLHAESIAFAPPGADPEDREAWIRVEAPLPKDLASTLRQLRKHAAPGSL
jgi:23S rRNA pseudouridine955/2504/2580 synthase/23S rRNA pseudouridine1911/1915/1917 synthase